MRLDTVTAEIRPRSDWEAVDLGFAMVRRSFWRCITRKPTRSGAPSVIEPSAGSTRISDRNIFSSTKYGPSVN